MTERPNQRDLLSLKWDVVTDVLSLFFFLPRVGGNQPFWRIAKIPL